MVSDTDWAEYVVPLAELPPGFDCLASFVAKLRPGILDWLIGAPEDDFAKDEQELHRVSAELGLPVYSVRAAAAFRRAGYEQQPAFQTGLIAGHVATDFRLSEFIRKRLSGRSLHDSRGLRHLIWKSHVDSDHPAAA